MDLTMERAPDLEFDDSTEEFEKGRLYGVEQGRKEERKRIVAMRNALMNQLAAADVNASNLRLFLSRIEQKEGSDGI